MSPHPRPRLKLEVLEGRDCPALNFAFDGLGNVLVTGNPDPGGLVISVAAPNLYTFDNGGTLALVNQPIPGGLTVQTGGTNDIISIQLDPGAMIGGNVMVDTGAGNDFVEIVGTDLSSTIGGNVTLSGLNAFLPNSVQSVTIGGSLRVNNFFENDGIVFGLSGANVGGDFFVGTGNGTDDIIIDGGTIIGGQVQALLGNSLAGTQSFTMTAGTSVGRNFTLLAGNLDDSVVLSGVIGGSAYLNFGNSVLSNTLAFNAGSFIGGQLTVFGGNGADSLDTFAGTVGGSVYANLMGGDNSFNVTGNVFGHSLNYFGGSGVDSFTFGATAQAPLASLYVSLGAGDDVVTLDSYPFTRGFINFGAGTDTLNQAPGLIFFNLILLNL